jgi:ElaB/YqjD/DUF883 family membrane-anchored ribosome-binding protein
MSITDTANDTGTTTNSGADGGGRVSAVTGKARDKASAAYGAARERTGSAYGTVRQGASQARSRTADGIETNPVGALIGGLAIGALVATLLPKSRRESELLGDFGRRINDTAREAARAATEAGKGKLDELGLNRDTAKQKLSDIAGGAGEALKTSAGAAAQTVKSGQQQPQ